MSGTSCAFDLEGGLADMRWPLPAGRNGTIEALGRQPSGRLAAVLYEGDVVLFPVALAATLFQRSRRRRQPAAT